MSRELIKNLFNEFFEFETEDRSIVTSVSCKFFAEYVFDKQQKRIVELEAEVSTLKAWQVIGDEELAVLNNKNSELDSELKFKNDYINELLAKGGDV